MTNAFILNEDTLKRFNDKIKLNTDPNLCHLWTGCTNTSGYGQFKVFGKMMLVHVLAYKLHYGDYTSSIYKQIDHICNNKICVNPLHLRVVSAEFNTLRSNNVCAKNARKTHCKYGHEFTPENTYIHKDGPRKGCRGCNECRRNAVRKSRMFK